VKVHVLLDAVGTGRMDAKYLDDLTQSPRPPRPCVCRPPFVPDDLAIETLLAARQRGVKIEIIVPGPDSDAKIVQSASRSRWGELLDGGVEIYEYQPTMYHCKVIIVDDLWVSVGSTNFDGRSFRLNDEANLNIYDAAFAAGQVKESEADKLQSRKMTRAEFKNRSAVGKWFDEVPGTLRRQL